MISQYIANNLLAMNECLLIIQPDASVTEINNIKMGEVLTKRKQEDYWVTGLMMKCLINGN